MGGGELGTKRRVIECRVGLNEHTSLPSPAQVLHTTAEARCFSHIIFAPITSSRVPPTTPSMLPCLPLVINWCLAFLCLSIRGADFSAPAFELVIKCFGRRSRTAGIAHCPGA